jgi:hypothetical protein
MTPEPSGRLYSVVTKYWPQIAAGLVTVTAIAEWVVGGLTASGGLESYMFAWAATSGGLWFLFTDWSGPFRVRSGARRGII